MIEIKPRLILRLPGAGESKWHLAFRIYSRVQWRSRRAPDLEAHRFVFVCSPCECCLFVAAGQISMPGGARSQLLSVTQASGIQNGGIRAGHVDTGQPAHPDVPTHDAVGALFSIRAPALAGATFHLRFLSDSAFGIDNRWPATSMSMCITLGSFN